MLTCPSGGGVENTAGREGRVGSLEGMTPRVQPGDEGGSDQCGDPGGFWI